MNYSLLSPVAPANPANPEGEHVAGIYAEALAERARVEPIYDEAIRFTYAGRQGFSMDANSATIYDPTAPVHAPEFASTIQASVLPNFARWAAHEAGVLIEDEAERAEVRGLLQSVDEFIFKMIHSSAAPGEVHEALMDLAVGTGCIRVDPGVGLHPLNVRAVAQRALAFRNGSDGQPDAVFEARCMTARAIEVDYPGCTLPPDEKTTEAKPPEAPRPKRFELVEGWVRDWSEPKANRWNMYVFFPKSGNHIGLEGSKAGAGASPYIGPFRWSKGSGEAWGRGPLVNLLPAMRVVNFAMQALIDHSDLALAGIYTVEDDGVVNVDTIRLEPGAIIPKAPGSQGLENLRPGQDFTIQEFMLTEQRTSIKQGLYADELGDPNRSPKTATEVQQRMASLARRIGSPFGRLINEFAIPFFRRVTRVLKDQGLIKLPQVDGRTVDLIAKSPLAEAQSFDDIDALDRFLGILGARFGAEAISVLADPVEAAQYLAERFRIPPKILRTKTQAGEAVTQTVGMLTNGQGNEAAPVAPAV